MSFDVILHTTRHGIVFATFDEPATRQQLDALEDLGIVNLYRIARKLGLIA